MVSTTCPSCSQDLEIDAKLLGKGVLCPYCHKLFVPPFPHSGFAVAACFLGPVAIVLEFFLLVYALIGTNWHTSFLPAERTSMLVAIPNGRKPQFRFVPDSETFRLAFLYAL